MSYTFYTIFDYKYPSQLKDKVKAFGHIPEDENKKILITLLHSTIRTLTLSSFLSNVMFILSNNFVLFFSPYFLYMILFTIILFFFLL